MSDDLTGLFLKKVDELEREVKSGYLIEDAVKGIEKLKNWLAGNRSLAQHRLCQKFMTFLWQSYGGEYKSRDGFVMRLKVVLGFADIKEKRFEDKLGRVCRDRMVAVKSLAFSSCTQRAHNDFFNKLKDYAIKEWGVDFILWENEFLQNPDLIQ